MIEEIKYTFVVTVVPNAGGVIKNLPNDPYVTSESGTDSLHPFDVMDVIRNELNSDDKPGYQSQIGDCLWHVKSVKLT